MGWSRRTRLACHAGDHLRGLRSKKSRHTTMSLRCRGVDGALAGTTGISDGFVGEELRNRGLPIAANPKSQQRWLDPSYQSGHFFLPEKPLTTTQQVKWSPVMIVSHVKVRFSITHFRQPLGPLSAVDHSASAWRTGTILMRCGGAILRDHVYAPDI